MAPPRINPYKVGPPVTGVDFYGRTELLYNVYQKLQQSNVVLLEGQRRIGKTSFLKYLATYLEKLSVTPQSIQLIPILFDIQRYVQDTLPRFQMHLAEVIAQSLQLTVPSLPEWEADQTLFQNSWLPQVYNQLGNRALVILVDEFDNLEGQTAAQSMQNVISFLAQVVSKESCFKWVFAFGRLAGKLPIQYDPIVAPGIRLYVDFLSLDETRELLEKTGKDFLTYKPEAISRIYQLTSGQPNLTQALGSELFHHVVLDQDKKIVMANDVDEVVVKTLTSYGSAIASIVRVPPIEERVLVAVAKITEKDETTTREKIIELLLKYDIRLGRDELDNALKSLLEWKLLKGSNKVQLYVELIRIWLFKNFSVELSREENLDIKSALAQSRFEIAEKARLAGFYTLAIKDYQEVLDYIPNHINTLKGLAEIYQVMGNLDERVNILNKLSQHDNTFINQFVQVCTEYAQKHEKEKNFLRATKQYAALLPYQNRDQNREILKQKIVENLVKALEDYCIKISLSLNIEISEFEKYIEKIEPVDKITQPFKKYILSNEIYEFQLLLNSGLAEIKPLLEGRSTLIDNSKTPEISEKFLKVTQFLEKLIEELKDLLRLEEESGVWHGERIFASSDTAPEKFKDIFYAFYAIFLPFSWILLLFFTLILLTLISCLAIPIFIVFLTVKYLFNILKY